MMSRPPMPGPPVLGQRVALRQGLVLTPGMRTALLVLRMPGAALRDFVGDRVAANPLLHWAEGFAPDGAPARRGEGADLSLLPAAPESPYAGLARQIAQNARSAAERCCFMAILEALDENGRLDADLSELARETGLAQEALEAARRRMLRFDPPGAAARSLAECLRAQLEAQGRDDPPVLALLAHLPALAEGGAKAAASASGLPLAAIPALLARLRALDPFPWRLSDREAPPPFVPDLVAAKGPDGAWDVALGMNLAQSVRLDTPLAGRAASGDRRVATWLSEARWLLCALSRRQRALLAVGRAILDRQRAFLEEGAASLRPLTITALAAELRVSASTVSRIVAGKYIALPAGTAPLRRFFSAAIRTGGGEERASAAARACLEALIRDESGGRPRSDRQLAEAMRQRGFDLSRRTIVKYRRRLGIESSFARKRPGR